MIWFTLLWVLLIPAIIMSAIATVAFISAALDMNTGESWCLGVGVFGVFFTVFLGWAIWVVYPFTAAAMG